MAAKIFFITLGFCLANAFYIDYNDYDGVTDRTLVMPLSHLRVARQAATSVGMNSDGNVNLGAKIPFAGNDKNVLSALGSATLRNGQLGAVGGGLALDNVKGHGLALTGTHIPKLGDQLAAEGRLNLLNTPNHNLDANAFVSKTFSSNPHIPDFTSHGGSLDYMFKNKVGASLGMSHTPAFDKTDYSAMGKLNIFRSPTSSFDFNTGVSKSVSPYIPHSNWQPSAGFSYTKFW